MLNFGGHVGFFVVVTPPRPLREQWYSPVGHSPGVPLSAAAAAASAAAVATSARQRSHQHEDKVLLTEKLTG